MERYGMDRAVEISIDIFMTKEIKKIIKASNFEIQEGRFVYAKVSQLPDIRNHFLVTRDEDEITVVTKEENLNELTVIEKNKELYSLIALNVSVPFYSVGFLAAVSQAVAKQEMNILVVSTYSKDYILVKSSKLEDAKAVLIKLGLKEFQKNCKQVEK